MSSDNYIDYPSMTRQRDSNIQQGLVAKADDVNAEFDNVVATYNRLISLLQGEFGGTGRIYELVDTAVAAANQAKTDAANAVKKTGDSMQGQLTTQLEPTSPYSMVNKQYVDNTMQTTVGPVSTLSNSNKERLDNLDATNVKLSNGNFSSNTVDGGMTELFQSVSSGKAAIASAITDKGVTTDANATFTTMHDNIYSIVTFAEGTALGNITPATVLKGYLGYSKGQAIVGEHVCDASEALKEADSLIPDNIAYGKKAFGSNGLITGTHRDSSGGETGPTYPTYGTDTSDATATANDLLEGKVAYSKGVRLTGKLKQVEELYKYNFDTVTDNIYNVSSDVQDDDGNVYHIVGVTFSKDNKSIIRIGVRYPDDGDTQEWAVFSNAFINNEPVIKATVASDGSTVNKKYKYTMEDLGITGKIVGIVITPGGAYGNPNLAHILIFENYYSEILTSDRLHIYQYHLTDNRVIGKIPGESIEPYTVDLNQFVTQAGYQVPTSATDTSGKCIMSVVGLYYYANASKGSYRDVVLQPPTLMSSRLESGIVTNKSPYHIFLGLPTASEVNTGAAGHYMSLNSIFHFRINLQASTDAQKFQYINKFTLYNHGSNSYTTKSIAFSENDKIIGWQFLGAQGFYVSQTLGFLDENYNISEAPNIRYLVNNVSNSDYYYTAPFIMNDTWNILTYTGYYYAEDGSGTQVKAPILRKVIKSENTQEYSYVDLKKLNGQMNNFFKNLSVNSYEYQRIVGGKWFDNILVLLWYVKYADRGHTYLIILELQADGTVDSYNTLKLDDDIRFTSYYPGSDIINNTQILFSIDSTETVIDGETYNIEIGLYNVLASADINARYHTVYVGVQEEVIAIRYKDKVYYNTQVENLTAGQPDVKKGKTFIGYMGYVEEGTMEVE